MNRVEAKASEALGFYRRVAVTRPQHELARLWAQGASEVEIAARLGTTVRNARARLTRLFRRLGIADQSRPLRPLRPLRGPRSKRRGSRARA